MLIIKRQAIKKSTLNVKIKLNLKLFNNEIVIKRFVD